jgi:SynChlorMet cassette radical SAM/SPASM protein ScmE
VYPSICAGNELSTKELLELIDEFGLIKIFTVRISGGEPFLREDLLLIVDSLIKKNVRISINTNAMFVNGSIVKTLLKYRERIDDIMVSIDGSRAEIHERLRGTGVFERTIEGIKKLTDAGLNVSAYTTVVKYNFHDIEEIIKLCKKIGISHVKFNELLPVGMGHKHYNELALNHQERKIVIQKLKKLSKKYNGFISGTYLQICEMFSVKQPGNNNLTLSGCGATLSNLTILPDGTVVPCDRMQDFVLGNVREKSIKEIWNFSPQLKIFRERFSKTINDIRECADCGYKNRCTGGCPAVPYYLKGDLFGMDPLSCYKIYAGLEDFSLKAHLEHRTRG